MPLCVGQAPFNVCFNAKRYAIEEWQQTKKIQQNSYPICCEEKEDGVHVVIEQLGHTADHIKSNGL